MKLFLTKILPVIICMSPAFAIAEEDNSPADIAVISAQGVGGAATAGYAVKTFNKDHEKIYVRKMNVLSAERELNREEYRSHISDVEVKEQIKKTNPDLYKAYSEIIAKDQELHKKITELRGPRNQAAENLRRLLEMANGADINHEAYNRMTYDDMIKNAREKFPNETPQAEKEFDKLNKELNSLEGRSRYNLNSAQNKKTLDQYRGLYDKIEDDFTKSAKHQGLVKAAKEKAKANLAAQKKALGKIKLWIASKIAAGAGGVVLAGAAVQNYFSMEVIPSSVIESKNFNVKTAPVHHVDSAVAHDVAVDRAD